MTDDGGVTVLLVEDNPGDVRLVEEAFREVGDDVDLRNVTDGEAALEYLHRRGEFESASVPDLVLLDLNLPKRSGDEILEEIKTTPRLQRIPVIILTGSTVREDVVRGYELGSNAYLTKPVDPDEFVDLVKSFEQFWCSTARLPPTTEQA